MKVLLDQNILWNSVISETKAMKKTLMWGDRAFSCEVLGCMEREISSDKISQQIPFIIGLFEEHRRTAQLVFYTSVELAMERVRQKTPYEGYLGVNILERIRFQRAKSPVERTIVFSGLGDSIGVAEEDQMQFFEGIKNPRFQKIVKHLGSSHIDDAFHLWTAETNNLNVFLTLDFRFKNVCRNQTKQIASPVCVMSPSELAAQLGVMPISVDELLSE